MTLPDTNISILDVRNILGYPSTDLGTLCTCDNINPFSKWKPIRSNKLAITATDLKNAGYGISITSSTGSIENLISAINNKGTFTYLKPYGTAASPYRLGDFRNYNHSARLPIYPMGYSEIKNAGKASSTLLGPISIGAYDGALSVGDLYDYFEDSSQTNPKLYRGIYMINSKNEALWCTGEVDWTEINGVDGNWYTGEITCYDFLTNIKKPTLNGNYISSTSDEFYAIVSNGLHPNPYTWILTGEAPPNSEKYGAIIAGQQSIDYKTVNFTLIFFTNSDKYSGGVTFTNLKVGISAQSALIPDPIATFNVIPQGTTTSYTLAKGVTKEFSGVINVPTGYRGIPTNLYINAYVDGSPIFSKNALVAKPAATLE